MFNCTVVLAYKWRTVENIYRFCRGPFAIDNDTGVGKRRIQLKFDTFVLFNACVISNIFGVLSINEGVVILFL